MRIDTVTAAGAPSVQSGERVRVRLSGSQINEAVQTGRADTLTLSDEAKAALEKMGKQVNKQNDLSGQIYNMKIELENSKQAAKAQADEATYKLKMLEIARRLQNGDRVPGKDEKALLEYDDKLYQVSKQIGMMKQKEKRKDYDSLLEDEEQEDMSPEIDAPQTVGVEISGEEGVPVEAADMREVTLD